MDEEWKRRILQRADDLTSPAAIKRTTAWGTRLAMRTTPQFLELVRGCAEARGMNISSYVRRAVAKQIAKDLRMDWLEVLALTPHPSTFNGSTSPRANERGVALPDDGTGFGDWS